MAKPDRTFWTKNALFEPLYSTTGRQEFFPLSRTSCSVPINYELIWKQVNCFRHFHPYNKNPISLSLIYQTWHSMLFRWKKLKTAQCWDCFKVLYRIEMLLLTPLSYGLQSIFISIISRLYQVTWVHITVDYLLHVAFGRSLAVKFKKLYTSLVANITV